MSLCDSRSGRRALREATAMVYGNYPWALVRGPVWGSLRPDPLSPYNKHLAIV